MMDLVEDIKLYLPQYLSEVEQGKLLNQMQSFAEQGLQDLYISNVEHPSQLWQGDGIDSVDYLVFPSTEIHKVPVMLLSNTCDMATENQRMYGSRILYAPILNLQKFEVQLKQNFNADRVNNLVSDIRRQKITQIMYLPAGHGMQNEGIVFFDRAISLSVDEDIIKMMCQQTKFSLNNFGFYLFLLKMSIHFTRVQEKIDRTICAKIGT